jgi:transcriptional regulator with XRE-family HTH domain
VNYNPSLFQTTIAFSIFKVWQKPPTHLGKKISRLRELRGMKQETLAEQLGISQQAVSKIEQSVEEHTLERIAKALSVTPGAIKNFSEEAVINNIQINYEGSNNTGAVSVNNHQCTFNPLDEVRKLNAEKEELYKALLKEKEEKIALLQKMIDKN